MRSIYVLSLIALAIAPIARFRCIIFIPDNFPINGILENQNGVKEEKRKYQKNRTCMLTTTTKLPQSKAGRRGRLAHQKKKTHWEMKERKSREADKNRNSKRRAVANQRRKIRVADQRNS